jgi:predicted RNA binding protein YcfA (HicA-like mRNA interferase family)
MEQAGFRIVRQVGTISRSDEPFSQIVVPDHKTLDRGTLRAILRSAGLTPERLRELL